MNALTQKVLAENIYSEEIEKNITHEKLLPAGLLNRLHKAYPEVSGIMDTGTKMFTDKHKYSGLKGFREIDEILKSHGIDMGFKEERELFIKIYRFMATRHVLNSINWNDFTQDSLFQLVFPQPGMITGQIVDDYKNAGSEVEQQKLIDEYIKRFTNPHDGKQLLNKPWFENMDGEMEFLEGSQHKYPQCELIFDKSTQDCFAFCTYCFRHAQVRGDEDMFVQENVEQIHDYSRQHKEVTDLLITGGDAGYITYDRMEKYAMPVLEDPELMHIKSIRLGTRVLTFHPEMILTDKYERMLKLFRNITDHGVQVVLMSHFSTPREVLNPATIAAIRRLKAYGVTIESQSPIMNHISMFMKEDGTCDVDRSAQNWIDLGNIFAMLGVGFHSMYCARPTGEHHYFTSSLADINRVFSKVYRELASINRPSRYITMTSSAGKISLMGTTEIKGEKLFVLKFNEGRNMEWLDKVYLAKYDEKENTIANLIPYEGEKHFFEDELIEIESRLEKAMEARLAKNKVATTQ